MRIHVSAIYSMLFAAFAEEDRVHAKSIPAWDNNAAQVMLTNSSASILRPKIPNSAISRHLDAIDPAQTYKYKKLGNDLGGDESKLFGSAVAISGDGTLVAVGSKGDYGYKGSVFVFQYDASALQWTQFGQRILGERGGDFSGTSLSMSKDGSRLVVGAPENGIRAAYYGHMRVYEYNSISGQWSQMGSDLDGENKNDNAGTSVTISGDGSRVAMGAPRSDSTTTTESDVGSVLIFSFDGSNWVASGNVIESEDRAYLGGSVALSYNGTRVVVGGTAYTPPTTGASLSNAGSVSVYDFDSVGSAWVQAGEIIIGLGYYDRFGSDVDISYDGTRIVVGAYTSDGQDLDRRNIGQATAYQQDTNSSEWIQIGQIIDGEQAYDYLGSSVTISGDGNVIAVGAPGNDDSGQTAGEVEMYQYIQADDDWRQIGFDLGGVDTGQNGGETFGGAVAVSEDGQRIIVGAQNSQYYSGLSSVYDIVIAGPTSSPSQLPSSTSSPTSSPSQLPSNVPSISIIPSVSPSVSANPSLSNQPSSKYDRVFQIKSTYSGFDSSKQWCLTAAIKDIGSKLHVRPCVSYASFSDNLQLFASDEFGQLKLAGPQNSYCVASTSRLIQLEDCAINIVENIENKQFTVDFLGGKLSHTKFGKIFNLGFPNGKRFSRMRLFKEGTFNESLDKWSWTFLEEGIL